MCELDPDDAADMCDEDNTKSQMCPISVTMIEADIGPAKSVKSAHPKCSSLTVKKVQRKENRRDQQEKKKRPYIATEEIPVEMSVVVIESQKVTDQVSPVFCAISGRLRS
jgi:hypothetical protein